MDPKLREVSKQLALDASANVDAPVSEKQALLLLAIAALTKLESLAESSDELSQTAKRARKTLKPHLADDEQPKEAPGTPQTQLDLGQYANTDVFDGNDKKASKFARLMGGAKGTSTSKHATYAMDSSSAKKVTSEIEEQFNAAVHHKGKKGLGL